MELFGGKERKKKRFHRETQNKAAEKEMLQRVDGVVWREGEEEEEIPWTRDNGGELETKDDVGSLSTFKSMLEDDWFVNSNGNLFHYHHGFQGTQNQQEIKDTTFISNPIVVENPLQTVDTSSSYSPSPLFNLDHCLSSRFNEICNIPFDNSFDLGCEPGFLIGNQTSNSSVLVNRGGGMLNGYEDLSSQGRMGTHDLSSSFQYASIHLLPVVDNSCTVSSGFNPIGLWGLDRCENSLFLNRSKVLRPPEIFSPVGAQPTLFQKRAALLQNSTLAADKGGTSGPLGCDIDQVSTIVEGYKEKRELEKEKENERDGVGFDGSGLNYDSDEDMENAKLEESTKNGGDNSNANSTVTGGDQKGKKKGLPAKNLMAERRRRKKLNDRLYMLRSVIPKISKMDRASILGDAVEYLKELLQRIDNLHNELESTPPSSSLPPTSSFYPLTPTPPTLTCHVKEELRPNSLPSPNGQPARVEVKVREGRAVNIHMFCSCRPGLLLSIMKALDGLGLDIQQAVISCFNGFALDIFRAEQCKEDVDILPEEIKTVLLGSAGFHARM